eukprot:SAG11_NODE_10121_length_853_cov_1.440318_2_plen_60_part_01
MEHGCARAAVVRTSTVVFFHVVINQDRTSIRVGEPRRTAAIDSANCWMVKIPALQLGVAE